MKFLAKNWASLCLLALCVGGLVLSIIILCGAGRLDNTAFEMGFSAKSLWIGYAIFFGGVALTLCVRIFTKLRVTAHGFLILTGAVVTVFMTVALVNMIDNWQMLVFGGSTRIQETWAILAIFPIAVQLVVFGLFPMIMGARRLVSAIKPK